MADMEVLIVGKNVLRCRALDGKFGVGNFDEVISDVQPEVPGTLK
jgi:hypothetical protein